MTPVTQHAPQPPALADKQPLLLDLFCGSGGAGAGYECAGFHVVGVDLDPKPLRHNPHEHYVGDALETLDTLIAGGVWQCYHLADFAAIHASPPCQEYSSLRAMKTRRYAAVLPETRQRLIATDLPWVVENVVNAPMHQGLLICGTALGLNVRRHRLFDCSHFIYGPGMCHHSSDNINVYGHGAWNYRPRADNVQYRHWTRKNALQSPLPIALAKTAFECEWMTQAELAECVPPAYTHWLGAQLMSAITAQERIA